VCSALRKIALDGNAGFGVVPGRPLKTEAGSSLLDEILSFVVENWERVGHAAWGDAQG